MSATCSSIPSSSAEGSPGCPSDIRAELELLDDRRFGNCRVPPLPHLDLSGLASSWFLSEIGGGRKDGMQWLANEGVPREALKVAGGNRAGEIEALAFEVTGVRRFPKKRFPTELVYGNTDHAALRLITCGGAFDVSTGHYVDNIVVFASLVGSR